MKTDYSEELRNLIDRNYKPVKPKLIGDENTVKKTLSFFHKEVTNILPSRWVQESDVYEALSELGFESCVYTFEEDTVWEGELVLEGSEKLIYLLERKTAAL